MTYEVMTAVMEALKAGGKKDHPCPAQNPSTPRAALSSVTGRVRQRGEPNLPPTALHLHHCHFKKQNSSTVAPPSLSRSCSFPFSLVQVVTFTAL